MNVFCCVMEVLLNDHKSAGYKNIKIVSVFNLILQTEFIINELIYT